jgi:signal transduction histidine kinase
MPPKVFTVDARAILTLGRESIKDHTTALIELVKNSYDADAEAVEIDIKLNSPEPLIRIADNGSGMTETQVETDWLRIGYSAKREERHSKLRRRKTGEKGIGRLSADRLGSVLELRTRSKGKTYGLKVDWENFDQPGKDLGAIPLEEIDKPTITIPKTRRHPKPTTGTELLIYGLRQPWTVTDIENLHRELSMLVSPFKHISAFTIILTTDVTDAYNGPVHSDFDKKAYITLDAKFDGKINVNYTVTIRKDKKGARQQEKKQAQLSHFLTTNGGGTAKRKKGENNEERKGASLSCGPVQLKLLFFPQKSNLFDLSELRKFLDANAGVRIYRDNIRVKPYGDPREVEGDWLKLGATFAANPAGASRRSGNIRPRQLVGTVFIGRDANHQLVDSSSREGLVHDDAFRDLRRFVLRCVREIAYSYHELYVKENPKVAQSNTAEQVKQLTSSLGQLRHGLRNITPVLAHAAEDAAEEAIQQIEGTLQTIRETVNSIADLENQAALYRGLASIGIASAVFGHEIEAPISGLNGFIADAREILSGKSPDIKEAIAHLDDALEDADKISGWGRFALLRIRRDKRRPRHQNIEQLVTDIMDELRPGLEALDINPEVKTQTIQGKLLPINLESIVINLITNAAYATRQVARKREMKIRLHKNSHEGTPGFELVVSDSGPGVPRSNLERIWEPLFTTKEEEAPGTGLGLTIVHDIVEEMQGTARVDRDPDIKGARFTIWLPLQ